MVPKPAGNIEAVHFFRRQTGLFQQRADAGAHGGFGQLNLANVLLCKKDLRTRDLPGRELLPLGDAGRLVVQKARLIHDPQLQQSGRCVQHARAAQTFRRSAAQDLHGDPAPAVGPDGGNGAGSGLHPAGEARAFKGRAHGGGGAVERPAVGEHNLAVGTQIDE